MKHHHTHLPSGHLPVSTYRLQLGPDLTFSAAKAQLDYLASLGITDIYCSPILQAAPGSTHGYDVVDHTKISEEMGGKDAFIAFSAKAHELGMGVVVDVVPNHMAVPTPLYLNKALWSVLKHGPASPYADWFDVEITEDGEGLLMPVLGSRIGTVLAQSELTLDEAIIPGFEDEGPQTVLRYYDHVFPVRASTEALPLADLLDRQFYRLAYWRVANEELNYRRFFDVDTLAAVRVEDEQVFADTHALLLELFRDGYIDGFRIDHPDGLADPRGYFRQLSAATDGAWIAAEKILDGDEELPSEWPIAGTTGYDSAWRIQSLHTDPTGLVILGSIMDDIAGDSPSSLDELIATSKREIVDTSLVAEVDRLARILADLCYEDLRLRDHTFSALRDCVVALIVSMDQYRAYIVPGEPAPAHSQKVLLDTKERAAALLTEDRHETLDLVTELLLGNEVGSAGRTNDAVRAELMVRFQQTCGPVMAKGLEDTAFYRWTLLTSTCEVGANPHQPTYTPDNMHAWVARTLPRWPATMTLGTTHDTKRGEDVRAKISVLSQYSHEWLATITQARKLSARQRPARLDGRTENLLWQTIFGTWTDEGPIAHERLTAYLMKAAREQKTWTTWTNPDEEGENALFMYARYLVSDPHINELFTALHEQTRHAYRSALLAIKATQLTMIGVADNYQGEEITHNSLVDPDNRRPIDYASLRTTMSSLESGLPHQASLDQEKMWVTSKILGARASSDAFVSASASYEPLPVTTGHAFAYLRSSQTDAFAVVTERLARGVSDAGGFQNHTVVLPEGTWTDILTETTYEGGHLALADLLDRLPVAVLKKG